MSELIYIVCAATSGFCALLTIRGYARHRTRLLFWSSVYFICQAASNVALVFDLVVYPDVDLSMLRRVLTALGTSVFLLALISEVDA